MASLVEAQLRGHQRIEIHMDNPLRSDRHGLRRRWVTAYPQAEPTATKTPTAPSGVGFTAMQKMGCADSSFTLDSLRS